MKQTEERKPPSWLKALQDELCTVYGAQEGLRVSFTVVPGILADFRKMLEKAAEGEAVREEYRMEDGRMYLVLEGRAEKRGRARRLIVTGITAGEKTLSRSEQGIMVF